MRVEYDSERDQAYIYLVDEARAGADFGFTYPCDPTEIGGMIQLDFDREGRLIGIEVLGASQKLPAELLQGGMG